jgi:hypothetical protein
MMTNYENYGLLREEFKLSDKELGAIRKRRWKKAVPKRAAEEKRLRQIEQRFHIAMREMHKTTDAYRYSYLHWILYQMFRIFDYETGLKAINDKAAYKSWLSRNKLT